MTQSRATFSKIWKNKKLIACILGVTSVCLLSWRGYVVYQRMPKMVPLNPRQLGLVYFNNSEDRIIGIDTEMFGFVGFRYYVEAERYHISTNKKLNDGQLPELVQALEEIEYPFELYLHQSELTTLTGLEKLDQLQWLVIYDKDSQLQDVSAIKNHPNLETVSFRNAKKLKQIKSLGTLPRLNYLDLQHCDLTAEEIKQFQLESGYTGRIDWE